VLSHNRAVVLLVLLTLLSAILGPVILTGYNDLGAARSALMEGRVSDAMRLYESSARKLFWRKDLWEQAGLSAYRSGDKEDSVRLLEIARQEDSLSAQGWNILGTVFWMNHDVTKSISVWESGLKAFPNSVLLYDQIIMAYHDQNDFAAEQYALTKRLALGEDAAAHYRLGLILTLFAVQRAQEQFNTASSLDPEFKSVTTTLIFALNASKSEPDPARQFVIIGRGLGLVEEWGLASKAFEHAVSLDGENAEGWAWLGEARQHQGQDGIKELDKALSLDPGDTVVHGLRGLYWKRQGKYSNALAEYQKAAQIEPEIPAWQISIGEAQTLNGDLVSALSSYQKATSLAPADASYWRLLAMFCADNDVHVLEIGLPAAQKAAELAPADPQVLDALGVSYLKAGYLYNAEQNLLKAIKLAPDFAQAHIHLAETYLQKGDRTPAFNELNLARQLDTNGLTGQLATQLLKQYFP
jgi:tetratricopeptide (TPR) repeat protein